MQAIVGLLVFIIALFIGHVSAAPKGTSHTAPKHEKGERLFCSTRDNEKPQHNGWINKDYRWVDFNVQFDPKNNDEEKGLILEAMTELSEILPCVNFAAFEADETLTGDYISIVRGNSGCSSLVGKYGGRQIMNLQSPGCMYVGTIIHEMIHALGFDHEQSRPDRDDYVIIHYENIEDGAEPNFEKLSDKYWSTFGVQYNYQSIMHYPGDAFSVNGKPTIEARDGSPVGSQDILQPSDIERLKTMYNC